MRIIILLFLLMVGFLVAVLYLRYLADKRVRLKLVCPVCSVAYQPEQFRQSETRKEKICAKCKVKELNNRKIGE